MTGPVDPNNPTPAETPPPYGAPAPPYGAPPPAYGTPPTYQGADYQLTGSGDAGRLASWGERAGGYLIDVLIIAVPSAIIGLAASSRLIEQLIAAIGGLIFGYLNGAYGQTPGKRVLHIKLVREQDQGLLGGGMGIVRWICHLVDTLALLLGWFWPLWDQKRQTFADGRHQDLAG
jgi:hypothetical protein